MFKKLTDRLREPSTWAALAALAAIAGHPVPSDVVQAIPTVLGSLGGLLGVVLAEKGS